MFNFSSIVLIGNFNPAIFHPEWLDRFKILPIQEIQWAEGLNIEKDEVEFKGHKLTIQTAPPPLIVTPEYSGLTFKSLKIEVRQERFDCKTFNRSNFSVIKEVSLKIFNLLEHTPVKGIGINFEGHWRFDGDASTILKNLFGTKNEYFESIFGPSYELGGRIVSRKDDYQLRIELHKSSVFKNGVHINANYHRDINSGRAEDAIDIINKKYDSDLADIIKINQEVLGHPSETYDNE